MTLNGREQIQKRDGWLESGLGHVSGQYNGSCLSTLGRISWTPAQGWSGFSHTAKRPDLNGAAHRLRARPADYISGSPDKANGLLFVSLPLRLPNYKSAHKFNKQMSFSSPLQHFPPPFALADNSMSVLCVFSTHADAHPVKMGVY